MEGFNVACKFRLPKNIESKTPMFLVDFANGHLNSNDCNSSLGFTSYRHVADGTLNSEDRRILIADNDRLHYRGTSFEENDVKKKLPLRYCVGVRNKNTGKMKVYDCIRFHLKPIFKSAKTLELKPEPKAYRDKMDDLTKDFGSKGKQRALESKLKYYTESSALPDAFTDVSANVSSPVDQKSSTLTHITPSGIDYIPPQNHEARIVNQVYNILDIISYEEDKHLSDIAEKFLIERPINISKWKNEFIVCSKYVLSHLENNLATDKVKYLIYYDYLVKFSKLGYNEIRKKDPAPEIPEPIKSKLLEHFTGTSIGESGKRARTIPLKMKDKLIAYLFVLALIIDDYSVNITLVQDGLKQGMSRMESIAQAVGCHVTQRKVKNSVFKFAELKFPLLVPQKHSRK